MMNRFLSYVHGSFVRQRKGRDNERGPGPLVPGLPFQSIAELVLWATLQVQQTIQTPQYPLRSSVSSIFQQWHQQLRDLRVPYQRSDRIGPCPLRINVTNGFTCRRSTSSTRRFNPVLHQIRKIRMTGTRYHINIVVIIRTLIFIRHKNSNRRAQSEAQFRA